MAARASDHAAEQTDGHRLDPGFDPKALFSLLDVKVRRRRLDADQCCHIVVRFAGRRPLQAFDLARAELRQFGANRPEKFRGAAALPDRARHDFKHAPFAGIQRPRLGASPS